MIIDVLLVASIVVTSFIQYSEIKKRHIKRSLAMSVFWLINAFILLLMASWKNDMRYIFVSFGYIAVGMFIVETIFEKRRLLKNAR